MSDKNTVKTVGEISFEADLKEVDPLIDNLIALEEERQDRRLILIPSESLCHPVVRRTMTSVYGNLYAEGYSSSQVTYHDEERLSDLSLQLGIYRRYADRRFYKGTDYINVVESLCKRRAAEAFANERAAASYIFANVQALSGAAANLAIFEAFLHPGDCILSMDLMHGGHLSHGSEFHISGRRYKIVSYGISSRTGLLDYDEIERIALETLPKLIIAGYTSYPWAPDWERFREIADESGALLMADIAHPAGMAIAGAYPNPVGIADVTAFTSHKTLMGPRGAVILTTDEEKAQAVDMAVFPGEQGGPHINTITALAVALKIANTEEFKRIQHAIVENAKHFAAALEEAGLSLAYGGTDTHLFLIDLKKLPRLTDEVLRGEMAVRLLELSGIVANKNTIPGDDLTATSTGVRMGTPWLTQRGVTKDQLTRLAKLISRLLHGIHPFKYEGLSGTLPRGKMDFDLLEEIKGGVAEISAELSGKEIEYSGYPHYHVTRPLEENAAEFADSGETGAAVKAAASSAAFFELKGGLIRVTGERVEAHMQNLVTGDLSELAADGAMRTLMLDGAGKVLDAVLVARIRERDDSRDNGFYVLPTPERAHTILAWMRGHADGYLLFEPEDITAKVEGPAFVEDLASNDAPEDGAMKYLALVGPKARELAEKHSPENGRAVSAPGEPVSFLFAAEESFKAERDALLNEGIPTAPFGAYSEAANAAGLKPAPESAGAAVDAGETDWFALHKPYFIGQLLVKDSIPLEEERNEFSFEPEDGGHKRTTLYDIHKALTRKIAPFAGWEMPVWYTSTIEEHRAVREGCGLFDVSHMGLFEVSGEGATDFLDLAASNYARWIGDGESYYAYLFNKDGIAIDDIMVYKLNRLRYLMVVNAANEDIDWAWLNHVNSGRALIDREVPHRRPLKPATLRNLKDPAHGDDRRVDLALQGPRSRDLLLTLLPDGEKQRLVNLLKAACGEFSLAGLPVVLSRTGYTGERIGFEIFVHPEKAPELWKKITDAGGSFGLKPCGLGARDSLRTEYGLPLFGHELEGDFEITPAGAGFPAYVKLHKPFFIGKKALMERDSKSDRVVVRFRVPAKGARPLRSGDPVINTRGDFIGNVTSAAIDGDGLQIGLAYVLEKAAKEGPIAVFPMPPEKRRGGIVSITELAEKTKTVLPVRAEIITRFPEKPEYKDILRGA